MQACCHYSIPGRGRQLQRPRAPQRSCGDDRQGLAGPVLLPTPPAARTGSRRRRARRGRADPDGGLAVRALRRQPDRRPPGAERPRADRPRHPAQGRGDVRRGAEGLGVRGAVADEPARGRRRPRRATDDEGAAARGRAVSPHVAPMLDLQEPEPIVLLERLRFLRGEPLVVTTAYMPPWSAPILELDMSDRSLFETYEQGLGLKLHRGTRDRGARGNRRAGPAPWPERRSARPRLHRRHLPRRRPPDRVLRRPAPGGSQPLRDRAVSPVRNSRLAGATPHTSPADGPRPRARADRLGLARDLVRSARGDREDEGDRLRRYDVFEDPLTTSDDERSAIKETCEARAADPVAVCIALGLVDFVPAYAGCARPLQGVHRPAGLLRRPQRAARGR